MSNVDILKIYEEELAETLSKEIAAEIDFGIISGFLVDSGWIEVILENYTSNKNAVDVADWTDANCKGKYQKHGRTYIFEKESDAVNFVLKWK